MAVGLRTALGVWLAAWLLIQAASAVFLLAGGFPSNPLEIPLVPLLAVLVIGWAIWVVALWFAVQERPGRAPTGGWRSAYAARWRPIDAAGVVVGALLQVAVVPAVYALLRSVWPEAFSEEALGEFAQGLFDRATSSVAMIALAVTVVLGAPVIEEFVYRGLLQRSLATRLSPMLAVAAVSVVFALVHARPVEYPGLFVVGLFFGGALVLTDRIATAIAVHMGFNLTAVVMIWPT
jgi:membrane protease YdiL (CAAX protease family)